MIERMHDDYKEVLDELSDDENIGSLIAMICRLCDQVWDDEPI